MRHKELLLSSLMLLCISGSLEAATRTVKAAGGGDFTTIQACANAAFAGDTCTVYAGIYNEYVSPARSGSAGSPITFQVNPGDTVTIYGFTLGSGRSYITIGGSSAGTGFNMTSNNSRFLILLDTNNHIIIQNNTIGGTSSGGGGAGQCIKNALNPANVSSYITINGNTIQWCGQPPISPGAGMVTYGDHWLIQNNTIAHVSDYISPYGANMVVRGNTLGPARCTDFGYSSDNDPSCDVFALHIDGFDHSCSGSDPFWNYNVIENNQMIDSTTPNAHFGLWHNSACTAGAEHNSIVRFNRSINVGAAFVQNDNNGHPGGYYNVKVYNNSVSGIVNKSNDLSDHLTGATGAASINNIYYNSVPTGSGYIIALDGTTSATFVGKNDLAYQPGCSLNCFTGYIANSVGRILNQDPRFVNPAADLHLQAGSPAIGAGTFLTTVAITDSGSGTSLVVVDAGFFQDGSGIVNADWIRVGNTNTAQIASINYVTNTITLANAISRLPGNPVYLYKDSNGTSVLLGSNPDIGAFQQQVSGPSAPTNLNVIVH